MDNTSFNQIVEDVRTKICTEWDEEQQRLFFLSNYREQTLSIYHYSLGQYIRNTYALWQHPWEPNIIDGVDWSPHHPDQMSMTIIQEVWLRGPIEEFSS